MSHSIELLSPAGNEEKLKYALAYGADAVYSGFPRFSLRARENDFDRSKLQHAIEYTHKHGKRIYLTLNVYPHNRKLQAIEESLHWVAEARPDGIILSDPGVIELARKICPDITIHLSTQANAVNWLAVKFWKNCGVKRIILPRELSLDEIGEIRDKVPDIELECFIHGSICIAYSGRCLISSYLAHRDSNQGTCTNSCRWEYRVYDEKKVFLEEMTRPGEMMPLEEDEHGSYVLNARDLCALELLPELINRGINSVKIEGRTKSLYYVSIVTRAYRRALDAIAAGRTIPQGSYDDVMSISNRGYIRGYSRKADDEQIINYNTPQVDSESYQFCGIVHDNSGPGVLKRISVRNRFSFGDELEIFTPHQQVKFKVEKLAAADGQERSVVHGGEEDIYLNIPIPASEFGLLRKPLNGI